MRMLRQVILYSGIMLTGGYILSCQPTSSDADMNNQSTELARLFSELKTAQSPVEIESPQADIWQIWLETGQAESDQWMARGITAMSEQAYDEAIDLFTQIIEAQPDYAEGWNKRATAYYLRGDYKASIADIQETLAREERHFGALSGLASIYRTIGDDRGALRTLEKLAAIIPADQAIQQQIQRLRGKLGIRNV